LLKRADGAFPAAIVSVLEGRPFPLDLKQQFTLDVLWSFILF
jgi:hypothetical protein